MNKFIYASIENSDDYGEIWDDFYKISPENIDLFLMAHRGDELEIISKEEAEESEQEIKEFKPPKLSPLKSESIMDIVEEAKGLYLTFLDAWARSGQNPEEWGCSVGFCNGLTWMKGPPPDVLEPIMKEYSEKKYLDKNVPKILEGVKSYNDKIKKQEKLYKLLNHKELL